MAHIYFALCTITHNNYIEAMHVIDILYTCTFIKIYSRQKSMDLLDNPSVFEREITDHVKNSCGLHFHLARYIT